MPRDSNRMENGGTLPSQVPGPVRDREGHQKLRVVDNSDVLV